MKLKRNFKTAAVLMVAGLSMMAARSVNAGKSANAIWAEDRLFGTVATPTSFHAPPPQSTDVIFSFAGSGLAGQRSVAVYAPADPAYNGGRWHVYAVTFTEAGQMAFDEDGDGIVNFELTNSDAVLEAAESGLLVIKDTEIYFECPLLPSKK